MPIVTARQVNWSRNSYGVVIGETSEKYILTHSEHLSQFSLTIMSPTINDSGLYYVTISHEAAVIMLKFQLEVLGIVIINTFMGSIIHFPPLQILLHHQPLSALHH